RQLADGDVAAERLRDPVQDDGAWHDGPLRDSLVGWAESSRPTEQDAQGKARLCLLQYGPVGTEGSANLTNHGPPHGSKPPREQDKKVARRFASGSRGHYPLMSSHGAETIFRPPHPW